jgi:uncharacterized protein YjbI with pentapeptide repeats
VANQEHVDLLDEGVSKWNDWCNSHPGLRADLRAADLENFDLSGANLLGADLRGASLFGAELSDVVLSNAQIIGADLTEADLTGATINWADASTAIFSKANLTDSDLRGSYFCEAKMNGAILQNASLTWADLEKADLRNADLQGADLSLTRLVRTDFRRADLRGCRVYGTSVWDVQMLDAKQQDLVITPAGAETVTVDELKVAQFIYLMLDNPEVRNVINTITSKAVLILGRFTPRRKPVLEALRRALRQKGYLPIVFDFKKPTNRTLTETVSILGRMSRFIVVDITDAKGVPQELSELIPFLPSVPVQPLLHKGKSQYALFEHWSKYPWVLPVYQYKGLNTIESEINQKIIDPAEHKLEKSG